MQLPPNMKITKECKSLDEKWAYKINISQEIVFFKIISIWIKLKLLVVLL